MEVKNAWFWNSPGTVVVGVDEMSIRMNESSSLSLSWLVALLVDGGASENPRPGQASFVALQLTL